MIAIRTKAMPWIATSLALLAMTVKGPSLRAKRGNPRTYWSVLKNRLKKVGSELATNCSQLKMESADGKNYLTDVANTEQLLRLVQSITLPAPATWCACNGSPQA